MPTRRLALARAAVLFLVVACGKGTSPATPAPSAAANPVRVVVTNSYALPVEIRVAGGNSELRLGTVYPGMTGRFAIPPLFTLSGNVEFIADPGSPAQPFRSQPLLLSPGAVVDFQAASQLFNSTVIVRQ